MSMDLAKKTYSTTPDYFIAGTTVGIVTAAKEADGAVAAHNLMTGWTAEHGRSKPRTARTLPRRNTKPTCGKRGRT